MSYQYKTNPNDLLDLRNESLGILLIEPVLLDIPNAPGNRDWQDFKRWEAAGNSPASAPLVALDDYKLEASAFVNNESIAQRRTYTSQGFATLNDEQRAEVDRYDARGGRITADDVPLMAGEVEDGIYPDIATCYTDWLAKKKADNPFIKNLDRYTRAQLAAIDAAENHRDVQNILKGLSFPDLTRPSRRR